MDFRTQLENSAPFAIRVLWVCFIAGPVFWVVSSAMKLSEMSSSEVASWVQAFGSIGAIMGAFAVANWQSRKQQIHREQEKSDRLLSLYAVIESAASHAKAMGEIAENRPPSCTFQGPWKSITVGAVQASVQALNTIPLHELGKAELVIQCMSIIGAMTQMLSDMNSFSEQPSPHLVDELYFRVDEQAGIVAYSWLKFSEYAGLRISSPRSC